MGRRINMFITLEGIDGSGKSTHIKYISYLLKKENIDHISLKEPGSTYVGDKIRELLLNNSMSIESEILLLYASRIEMIRTKIIPTLNEDKWVICDRYNDSTYAYQCGGRRFDKVKVRVLEEDFLGESFIHPDLTLLFDVTIENSLKRTQKTDIYENESFEFYTRVRDEYLDMAEWNPNFIVIDANKSVPEIQVQIKNILSRYF